MPSDPVVAFDKRSFMRITLSSGLIGAAIALSLIYVLLDARFPFIKPIPAVLYTISCFVLLGTYVKGSASYICCLATAIAFIFYTCGDTALLYETNDAGVYGVVFFSVGHLIFSSPALFPIVHKHRYWPSFKFWQSFLIFFVIEFCVFVFGSLRCGLDFQSFLLVPYVGLLGFAAWRILQFDSLKTRYRIISFGFFFVFLISDSIIAVRNICGYEKHIAYHQGDIMVTYYMSIGILACTCLANSFSQASKVTKQALQYVVRPNKDD